MRVLASPPPIRLKNPGAALQRERQHVYLEALPQRVSSDVLDVFERSRSAEHVSDAYLLTLARQHKAVFLTFDTKLRELAGPGGKAEVLGI